MKKLNILLLFLILIGCQQQKTAESEVSKQEEGIILKLEGGNWGLPNPFKHDRRGPGFANMQLIYDSLIEKDEKGFIPWLAKKWEISEEGTKMKFYLNEGIEWQDGKPLTAEDIKFSFEYYKKNSPVSNELYNGKEYIITNVKVIDPLTVEIETVAAVPTFFSRIGFARIIPKHIWENVEDPKKFTGDGYLIGSGPFTIKEFNLEQGIYKFEKFDKFWGPKTKLKGIELVPVSDSILAFENKEIDLVTVSPDLLNKYENNPEYKVEKYFAQHYYRFVMNIDKSESLKNLNTRKALAYGINRKNIVDKVERGSGIIGSMGYIPETHQFYNSNIEKYEYNPEKSKKLIENKKLTFNLIIGNSPKEIKIAELIKNDLEQIGVKLVIKSLDSKVRDVYIKEGKFEIALTPLGGLGGDPGYLRTIYGKDGEIPGYFNKEIQILLEKQDLEMNEIKRTEEIKKLQELIAEDVPMILLYGYYDNYVYRHNFYDGWTPRFDSGKLNHSKLSYLERE